MGNQITTDFNSDGILYYPTIELLNESWLKSALIFWDKVFRIVPENYHPKDSYEMSIARDAGLIENISLNYEDLNKTAKKFEQYCNKLPWYPDGFDSKTYEVRLHSDKIDNRLKPFFSKFSSSIDTEGFYKIPDKIANGYMFFLSDTISKRRNIPKLTDNPDMFAAMTYFDGEGNFDESFMNINAGELYTNLIIENIIPSDIESMSIKKLIEINKEYEDIKKEFRIMVSSFCNKLSRTEDNDSLIKEIEKFKNMISGVKSERNNFFKTYFKEFKESLLYVGMPACAISLMGSVFINKDDLFSLVPELAKGMVFACVASFGDTQRNIRKKWSSKRSNYYLELKKHLISENKSKLQISDISYRLNEFIND